MPRQLLAALFALILVLLCGNTHAVLPEPVTLEPERRMVELGDHLAVLPHRKNLTAMQALQQPPSAWTTHNKVAVNLGLQSGEFWLQTTLANRGTQPVQRLLVTDYPDIDSATLYYVRADGRPRPLYENAGTSNAFIVRPQQHRRLVNPITLGPGEMVTLMWRIESYPLFRFRAALWQQRAYYQHDHHRVLLYGMLYGALMIMAVYNLFLWISVQEKHYVFYVLFLLCTGYLVGADEGHIYQYLAPDTDWPKTAVYSLFSIGAVITFFLFSSAFLRLRRKQPTVYRWMLWLALLNIALAVLGGIFGLVWAVRGGLIAAIPLYLLALAAAVRIRLTGVLPAGHYAVAILLLVAGVVLNNLSLLGLLPLETDIGSFTAIGTVLMMAFFSLALANKISELQRDSAAASSGIARAHLEIHRINDELVKAQEERARLEHIAIAARKESVAKSGFLATIGHEIRTPMSGVLGMAELLKGTELDANQLHYVSVIERSGHNLMEMISDLLDYAIAEGGAMELEIEPFDIESLTDDCVALFTLRAVEKNIGLFAEIDPDVPARLKGDAGKLRQIVLNLLTNAFKFTEQGDIVLRISRSGRESVNAVELRFEVSDTGVGLSEEAIAQLFSPFTGEQRPGRGLGLAISRQLVQLMDGELGVDSMPGEGSRFWFTARLMLTGAEVSAAPPLLTGRRLLLVARDSPVIAAMQRTLTSWGGSVSMATDGDSARAALGESQGFDLVLLEQQLPNGSGLEIAAALRREFTPPPMLLITGANLPPASHELEQSGIDIVLEKPITHGPLRDGLVRALGQRRSGEAQAPLQQASESFGHLRALIVEDNQVNQLVMSGLLKRLGIVAQLVDNGAAAIEACHRQTFDIILMDCEMPELDGYATTRQIRAMEQADGHRHTRIVAVSAHASSDHQQKAVEAGMDSYLTKPITQRDLAGELGKL